PTPTPDLKGIAAGGTAVLPLRIVPGKKDHLDRLQSEVQELIDELWQVPRFSGLRRGFRPQVDVIRTDDPPEYRVVVELAGSTRRPCGSSPTTGRSSLRVPAHLP